MARTKKQAKKKKAPTARPLPTRSRTTSTNNKQKSSSNRSKFANVTKDDKQAREMILDPIIERILVEERNNKIKGRPLYGKIKETVEKYASLLPWLTKDLLKKRVQRRRLKYKKLNDEMAALITTPTPIPDHSLTQTHTSNSDVVHSIPTAISISSSSSSSSTLTVSSSETSTGNPIGRPFGSTVAAKQFRKDCEKAAINEIAAEYYKVWKKAGGARVKKGTYKAIHDKVKHDRNLPESFDCSYSSIRQRIVNDNIFVPIDKRPGPLTPLAAIEPKIHEVILLMAKHRIPLRAGQGTVMINSAIEGTQSQQKLIDYKIKIKSKQDEDSLGTISPQYWDNFMRRYNDKLDSKKGVKFELQRDNYVTYTNFEDMYDCIEALLVDEAKVAVRLDQPVWMNKDGKEVDELESFGMKVKIEITDPDACITLDEVGLNTSMMKDGSVGGTKYIVGKGQQCQIKASKKDKRFTVLGLTCFSGDPVMCVVIIDAKNRDIFTELGIDPEAPINEHADTINLSDEEAGLDLLINNIGKGKRFPGGPTCVYKGKEIECMVRFNEGGGINGKILKEIFETLDEKQVFVDLRAQGKKPFVLLDGHQSRFDITFLEYINNPEHLWTFAIGVPYGTALWQVGDSTEQNGCFKMHTSKKKNELLRGRMRNFYCDMGITTQDIIPIINTGWDNSFARVRTNRKAYCERGWCPYNRNLLLD